jgi:opacity protein-like surface antigen
MSPAVSQVSKADLRNWPPFQGKEEIMKRMLSIAMLALLLCCPAFAQDQTAKQEAAKQAAQSWLALVDRGDYGPSWQQAASFFQSKISKADWENALKQGRTPLGAAGSRTLLGALYQTDLPNAPKGEYVIIQYKTEMASGGAVVETVTPMLDNDGKWRVSGYFVKPAL